MFFLTLAPVANIAILIGTIMGERFLYLPAVGFLGCVVWAIYAAADRVNQQRGSTAIRPVWVIGALCVALIFRTYARNADWENSRTLFESAASVSADSYKTHLNLGLEIFRDQSRVDRAIVEGERSVGILKSLPLDKDEDVAPYINLGSYYRVKGDLVRHAQSPNYEAASAQWYQKSLEVLQHGLAVDRSHSGMLLRLNREARRPLTAVGVYQLYQELAETYLRTGEPRKAIEALEYGSTLSFEPELFQMKSEAYTMLHDREGTAIALMEGLVMRPDEPKFASELVDLYRDRPFSCAINKGPNGASLNLQCPEVHDHFCAGARLVRDLFERRDLHADAEKVRQTALQTFGCSLQ